ncbi:ATP-binding protein [Sphingobacterium sp. SRCM116780]|uniref:tetratricopeptide repeat-containing sensor histidine kinase n=1 Tax=Sphingobacterium sp. SRCM116780 TaxID=2907623 RepID=UPI001F2A672B|nr:tetratricopeptide repeat-containing sensor histidine kinase [Sphingobacterium sp. SRCM116780]UIR54857.1 ATP-binding protein [Sphingobacterium sp. SRCM116780]
MAIIQKDEGDYFGAQETALQAIDYLDKNNSQNRTYLSHNYNNLGVATYQLKDYDKALYFYDLAIKYSNDSLSNQIYLNNKAKVYHDNGNYSEAITIYTKILNETGKNRKEYARFLTNIALSRWQQNHNYNPTHDLLIALNIRKDDDDIMGLNSSYTHLTDYYMDNKPDSALFYARKLYTVAKQLKNTEDEMKAVERLAYVSSPDSARNYFKIYQQLSDSIQQARSAAKNQFAVIRYEVEKNKSDNLMLQKDNAEKANRLTRQRVVTGGITLLSIVLLGGGSIYYKKRKQRLELEAQNKIKASQLKTSRKVHDVVANGLYRVMIEIENRDDIDRTGILDRLEEMYDKSRDISYEGEEQKETDRPYNEYIAELLKSFASDSHKVLIAGNEVDLWQSVDKQAKEEIAHVLQELMVNMKKHSQADNVVVRFEKSNNQLHIYFSDNGVGMEKDKLYGNGLTNTGNRIESLGGKINFAGELGKGLKVEVIIPLC